MTKRRLLLGVLFAALLGASPLAQTFTSQIQAFWNELRTGVIAFSTLHIQAGGYENFGATLGASGYGIRDNAGTIEVKNSGGGWAGFPASFVSSITGTANQVIASSPTGAVTLSLPQSIALSSTPIFAGLGPLTGPVTLDPTSGNAVRRQMTTPAAPTMSQNQSGTDVAAGTYQTAMACVDPGGGVSLPSATQAVTVGAGGAGRIVFTYTASTGSASCRAYVSLAAGTVPDRYFSCTASPCNVSTLTGATVEALPTTNTAYQFSIGSSPNWFGNQLLGPVGSNSVPTWSFAGDPDTGFVNSSANVIGVVSGGVRNITFGNFGISFESVGAGTFLSDENNAILQLGRDAAGVTDQTIKGPDRITSDGVGGNLTIAGGRNRGASAGGSVIFQTAPAAGATVTGTLATRLTIDSTGLTTHLLDNLVTTSTSALRLQNSTAALVDVPVQISPRSSWMGTAWDTDDAVSRNVSFFAETLPTSGTTVAGSWKLGYINPITSALTYPFVITSGGAITLSGGSASIDLSAGSVVKFGTNAEFKDAGVGLFNFTKTGNTAGVGIDAATAGLLKIRTIAQTGYGNIDVGNTSTSGVLTISATAPTIASGGCTSPAITNSNGTAKFRVTLGTSCTNVKTVTLTLPASANAWQCDVTDNTSPITYVVSTQSTSATAVVLSNILRTNGLAADFVDGEVLLVKCMGG